MYTFKSRVRFSETGDNGKLTLPHLISYFQDCSNLHSESIGIGRRELEKINRAWFLCSWQIIINDMPGMDENIEVETRAYGFNGFYGNRNFMIYDDKKKLRAYANSIWFYVDTVKGKAVKYVPEAGNTFPIDEEFPMEKADRKIIVPKEAERVFSEERLRVRKSHLDTNFHMNNREYVRVATDYIPESIDFDEGRLKELRVEYRKAAVISDIMIPVYCYDRAAGRIYVSLENENEDVYAKVELAYRPEN